MKRASPLAMLALWAALLPACFGYNRSAKGWSYFGDSLLVAGGGAAIAVDATSKSTPCTGTGCDMYKEPFSGMLVTGVVLVTAGVVGMILNATRPNVRSSSH